MSNTLSYSRRVARVMLIQPPAYVLKDKSDMNPNVPLGLAYLAAVLEKSGYEVNVLDAFMEGLDNEIRVDDERVLIGLGDQQIEKRLKDFKPDVVGVSSLFTMQRKNAHRMCAIAKNVLRDVIVIMGGAHPTAEPRMVLEDMHVDYVIRGEGELALSELLDCLKCGKDFSNVDGLCSRLNGGLVIKEKKTFIENLDSLYFPARHLLPMEKYFLFKKSHGANKRTPYASIVTSRGCPFGCTFCSTHMVWGRHYRFRTARNVLDEIRFLVQRYGIKELLFEDDNLTLNRVRAVEIFQGLIREKFYLIWRTPNGISVDTLDEELLDLMKESGCYQLGFAIESGCQQVLDTIIKKPMELVKAQRLVKYAKKIGIEVILFLVVGMPGETLKEMRATFRFARSLGSIDQHISIATPYPGSALFEICKEKGFFAKGFNYDRLSIRKPNIETPDWSGQELMELIKEERRKSNLCCGFSDPVLFLKALVPESIKSRIKRWLKYPHAINVYKRP